MHGHFIANISDIHRISESSMAIVWEGAVWRLPKMEALRLQEETKKVLRSVLLPNKEGLLLSGVASLQHLTFKTTPHLWFGEGVSGYSGLPNSLEKAWPHKSSWNGLLLKLHHKLFIFTSRWSTGSVDAWSCDRGKPWSRSHPAPRRPWQVHQAHRWPRQQAVRSLQVHNVLDFWLELLDLMLYHFFVQEDGVRVQPAHWLRSKELARRPSKRDSPKDGAWRSAARSWGGVEHIARQLSQWTDGLQTSGWISIVLRQRVKHGYLFEIMLRHLFTRTNVKVDSLLWYNSWLISQAPLTFSRCMF